MRIQSIPTVIAFHNKQIADGFQGVLPKSKIVEFIEKVLGTPLQKNKDEFYSKIRDLIKNNEFNKAVNNIEDFLSENSNDLKAIALYIECLYSLEKFQETKEFIDSLSDAVTSDTNIQKAIKQFIMLESASKEPSVEVLLSNYSKQPDDYKVLLKLCDKYFFEKQYEKAFDLLFDNYAKSKNTNKEKIKGALINYFDALGNNHEQTKIYRRKLSSLLFS